VNRTILEETGVSLRLHFPNHVGPVIFSTILERTGVARGKSKLRGNCRGCDSPFCSILKHGQVWRTHQPCVATVVLRFRCHDRCSQ